MSTAKRLLKLVDKHRQVEVAQVESAGRNSWDLRVSGRAHPYSGVGGTWLDSDNSEGEDVAIAFGFGNPLLPIMFSRGSRPLAVFTPTAGSSYADHYESWFRFGTRMSLRHYATGWDADSDTSITLSSSGFGGNGSIIRAYSDGMVYVANVSDLVAIDIPGETSTTTDLGSTISSLSIGETSNRVYCTTLTFVSGGGGGDCYVTGYDAAIAESGAFTQGQSDCLEELGYRAAELAAAWAEANAPTEGGEDCISDWISGATVGYTEQYNLGYESEGCVIPE